MGSTLTTFDALLKERYADPALVEQLTEPEHPFYSMCEKAGAADLAGSEFVVPIIYSNPQGVAADYTNAYANTGNIKASAWHIIAGDQVGVVLIGQKVIEAARANNGAILDAKRVEIDGLFTTMAEAQSAYIWGNGGNAIGQVGSWSTNTITLQDKSQICNFEVGMELVFSGDGDGSAGTETARTGSSTVSAVDRINGTVTITASEITAEADGDYIFREGDFNGASDVTVLKGVQCFVSTATTLPTLWSVTNTVRAYDRQRFGGCYIPDGDMVGFSYEARIKTLLNRMNSRYKSKTPTAGFMNPEDFQELETDLEARRITPEKDNETKFGFMKISVVTGTGVIPIYSDRHVPKGHFFALRMEDWKLHWMGPGLIHPQTGADGEGLLNYASTDHEFRLLSFPGLSCRAPKNSGRVRLY